MKNALYMMALCMGLLPLTGCMTLADTPNENAIRVQHAIYTTWLQLPDDAEHIFFLDRPMWLTRLPVPND